MKNLKITVNGTTYDVQVEETGASAPAAPAVAAAPAAPAAATPAAPAPAPEKKAAAAPAADARYHCFCQRQRRPGRQKGRCARCTGSHEDGKRNYGAA